MTYILVEVYGTSAPELESEHNLRRILPCFVCPVGVHHGHVLILLVHIMVTYVHLRTVQFPANMTYPEAYAPRTFQHGHHAVFLDNVQSGPSPTFACRLRKREV